MIEVGGVKWNIKITREQGSNIYLENVADLFGHYGFKDIKAKVDVVKRASETVEFFNPDETKWAIVEPHGNGLYTAMLLVK